MTKWCDQLAASDGVALTTEMKAGDNLATVPPMPDMAVEKSVLLEVERVVYHAMVVKAERDGRSERIAVGRLVAVLKDGGELEFEREAHPATQVESEVDTSMCASCGGTIPDGEAVMLCGHLGMAGFCQHPGVRAGEEACEYEQEGRFSECDLCDQLLAYHGRCVQ